MTQHRAASINQGLCSHFILLVVCQGLTLVGLSTAGGVICLMVLCTMSGAGGPRCRWGCRAAHAVTGGGLLELLDVSHSFVGFAYFFFGSPLVSQMSLKWNCFHSDGIVDRGGPFLLHISC